MKNIEKFADELNRVWGRDEDFAVIRDTNKPVGCGALYDCNGCLFDGVCSEKNKIGWLLGEYEESILDEVEKKYLEGVFKPFKDNVTCVYKLYNNYFGYEQILYVMSDKDVLELPKFAKGAMYKGMEENKKYSLKELGLYEK